MQLNKSFHEAKSKTKNIIKMVTLAHASECTMQQFNSYYDSEQSDNFVKNIYKSVLANQQSDFNTLRTNYLIWVINHSICSLVEEIHLLYINLLHLMKVNGVKFSSNITIESLLNELEKQYYDIKKYYANFAPTHKEICEQLNIDKSFEDFFQTIINVRNCITHDGSIVSKQKNKNIQINYLTLTFSEIPIPNTNQKEVQIKINKKSKEFEFGELVHFTYSEFNEISFTIVEFIKKLETSFTNIIKQK